MSRWHGRRSAASVKVALLALSATIFTDASAQAQAPAVDPEAVQHLRRTTDYLSGLEQFAVRARNFREDVLESGHRVDFEASGSVTVRRPNKLRGERHDAHMQQVLYYDGTTLTLYSPPHQAYATEPAPGTIEEMFAFAHESLGLYIPASDLIWRNVFPLLMQDVTHAVVVGKEVIGGLTCDHLLFSRPDVDFQICVADSGPPLPLKFVVTDTGTPELLSIVTLLSDWDVDAAAPDADFTFVPPEEAKAIPFLKLEADSGPRP